MAFDGPQCLLVQCPIKEGGGFGSVPQSFIGHDMAIVTRNVYLERLLQCLISPFVLHGLESKPHGADVGGPDRPDQ